MLLTISCSPKPVTLGFVDGLSGAASDLGVSSRDGALLAVEQRNAHGGVKGRKIKLIVKDDQHDPSVAKNVVQELLDAGVEAIIGHGTSNTAMATVPLVTKAKVLMMSHTVTTKKLSVAGDYFFRVVSATDKFAIKNAKFRRHVLKRKKYFHCLRYA